MLYGCTGDGTGVFWEQNFAENFRKIPYKLVTAPPPCPQKLHVRAATARPNGATVGHFLAVRGLLALVGPIAGVAFLPGAPGGHTCPLPPHHNSAYGKGATQNTPHTVCVWYNILWSTISLYAVALGPWDLWGCTVPPQHPPLMF